MPADARESEERGARGQAAGAEESQEPGVRVSAAEERGARVRGAGAGEPGKSGVRATEERGARARVAAAEESQEPGVRVSAAEKREARVQDAGTAAEYQKRGADMRAGAESGVDAQPATAGPGAGGVRAASSDQGADVRPTSSEPEAGVPLGDVQDPEGQAEMVVRDAISAPDAEGHPRRVTRRFPLFTKDTARPEGGGRAAPRGAPAPARQWPVLAVLAAVAIGLLLTALDQFRYGTLLIGLALLAGGVLRWLVPDVGMLAVRSRFTDIATYGVLGTVIVLLAMMVQPNPWLVIPFLKDTLHFTVSSN